MLRVSKHTRECGFALAPILYLLGLIGVGAGVLFSGYSQILRTNQTMSNTLAAKNELQGSATTISATSWLSSKKGMLCPPLTGSTPSPPSVGDATTDGCDGITGVSTIGTAIGAQATLPANASSATSGGSPMQAGIFNAGGGVKVLDPWGHNYIYCRWENAIGGSNAFSIISAGANGRLESTCGSTTAGGDDQLVVMSTAVAQNRAAVWQTTTTGTSVTGAGFGATGSQVYIDTAGDMIVPGTLTVGTGAQGTMSVGPVTATAIVDTGTLNVTGLASMGDISAAAITAGSSTLTSAAVTGNASVGGTLNVTGQSTLGQVTAGSSVIDSMAVTGTSYFGGILSTSTSPIHIGTTVATGSSIPLLTVGKGVGTPAVYPFYVDQNGTAVGSFSGDLVGSQSGGSVSATTLSASGNTTLGGTLGGTSATFSGDVTAASFTGTMDISGGSGMSFTGTLPIANGGTGQATAATALTALFSGAGTLSGIVPAADVACCVQSSQMSTTGVAAGTYSTVTVDTAGRVTSGTVGAVTGSSISDGSGETVSVGSSSGIQFSIGSSVVGNWTSTGLMVGTSTPATNMLDVSGAQAIGAGYAGVATAPANGLIVEGKVGIGTNDPGTSALAVNGTITATTFVGDGSGLGGLGHVNTSSAGQVAYYPSDGATVVGTTSMYVVNGNVGISSSVPTLPLDVGGWIHSSTGFTTGDSAVSLNSDGSVKLSAGNWYAKFGNTDCSGGCFDLAGTNGGGTRQFRFKDINNSYENASANYLMVIDINTGKVGVGTTAPQSLVEAFGGEVQVGSSGASCAGANGGAIRYSGSTLYYCDGSSTWQTLLSSGGGGAGVTGTGTTGYDAIWTSPTSIGTGLIAENNSKVGIGTATLNTLLDVNGDLALRLGTDYSTTGAQNNVALGSYSAVRYTGASTATFTGIAAGQPGKLLYLHNASSSAVTLANQSTSSTAANRIITGTGGDLTMAANTSVTLQYDDTASRWRIISGSSGISGTVNTGSAGQAAYYPSDGTTVVGTSSMYFVDGNVGIGSTSPATPLDVSGNIRSTGQILATSNDPSAVAFGSATQSNQGMYFPDGSTVAFSVSGFERWYIASDGGLYSAQSSGQSGGLLWQAATATAPTFIPNQSNANAGIGANTAGNVSIIADNGGAATEMLRITGTNSNFVAGNVGIGSATPATKLDVGGTGRFTGNVTLLGTGNAVGTITSGTWNGTAIGPTYGGTGLTSYATGDILYASGANTLSKLAAGSDGDVLTLASGVPSWSTVSIGTGSLTGVVTVPHGGTGLTTLTQNVIYKGDGTNPLAASSLTDDGTIVSTSENFDITTKAVVKEIANEGSTGTAVKLLAKLTGAPSTARTAQTSDTGGIVGIVTGGAGTTGSAQIATSGFATCTFDNATTAGHYVGISSTAAGKCHDAGAAYPTSGQVIGRVLASGAAGDYAVNLFDAEVSAGGNGTVSTGSAGQVAYYESDGTTVVGTTSMYIAGGSVGIGSSSPVTLLDVAGTGRFTGNVTMLGTGNAVGTITGGTWNGTAIGPTYGGTGLTSYATGDILYASGANTLAKLAAGTNGYVLTLAGGVPTWAATASTGLTVGTTTIASGSDTKVLFDNSGVLGEYTITGTGNVMMSASPTTTGTLTAATINASGVFTDTQALAANTSGDGLVLTNTTAATSGNQRYSPRLHFTGQGWKTNATAASQAVDFINELQPVQGAANPSGNLVWSSSINGGGYSALMTLTSGGSVGIGSSTPAVPLDVSGNIRSTGQVLATSNDPSAVAFGSAAQSNQGMYFPDGSTVAFSVSGFERWYIASDGGLYSAQSSGQSGGLLWQAATATAPTFIPNQSNANAGIGANTAGNVSIIADNGGAATEMLCITGTNSNFVAGNVGIGSATPATKLDVAGTGRFTGNVTMLGTGNAVGTITSGTWNGTAIGPTYGGTGLTSYATGDILYASGANTLSKLAAGTNGYVLTLAGGVPTWAATASTGVTGTGSTGYDAIWTSATTIGTGLIAENSSKVGIGTAVMNTLLDVNGDLALRLAADFTTTGSQNNVAISASNSAIRFNGAANATFTGIAGGQPGKILYLHNATSNKTLTLSNQSASSTAANRIITGTGSDLTMAADTSVALQYDDSASRWRVVSTGSGVTQIDDLSDAAADYTNHNVFLGQGAGGSITSGTGNLGIGENALNANDTGGTNIGIGPWALETNTDGDDNVAIGWSILSNQTYGNGNVAIGARAMDGNTNGDDNVVIGTDAFHDAGGAYQNVVIGVGAGYQAVSSYYNILIGTNAASNILAGGNNIVIGYDIDIPDPDGYGQLVIGNLIYGTGIDGTGTTISTGNIGIGSNTPAAKLDVAGTGRFTGNVTMLGTGNAVGTITSGTWNGTAVAVGYGGTGLTSGTSGGIPYFSSSSTIASSGALTANMPVIGGGAGATPTVGTVTGNTTKFTTSTGTLTSGNCAKWDVNGNIIDAGTTCGGSGIGPGTTGYDAIWTSATTIGTGLIAENSSKVGIGTAVMNTLLDVNGDLALRLAADFTTTGAQNNVAISASNSAIRFAGAADATFTGIASGKAGKILYLHNATSNRTLTLSNQSASSTAANRIITGTGADMSIDANKSVVIQYDDTDSRWRVIGGSAVGGVSAIDDLSDAITIYGQHDVFLGQGAGVAGTAGWAAVAVGEGALGSLTTGDGNTAVGYTALATNTEGYFNTAVGMGAMMLNETGPGNSAFGSGTLGANVDGCCNTAMGQNALAANTAGWDNTAIGFEALMVAVTGTDNVAIGDSAGHALTEGIANVAVGEWALSGVTTGNYNIGLGGHAGANITTGTNNIVIGYGIDAPSATASGQLVIGNLIYSRGIDGTGTTISTGNIGIGSNTPATKLDVAGTGRFTGNVTLLGTGNAVGTITSGIWNGTAIGPTYGGTGLTSYATGDILYASGANTLAKLAAGTNGYVLTLAGGVPTWAATASTGLTVGTTTIASGSDTKVLFDNSGVLGEYTITGTGNVMMSASPTTTGTLTAATINASGVFTDTQALAANTSGDGLVLTNTTAATSGNQRYSPRLHFTGQGWKTNATAASQAVDFINELQPVQGAANPSGNLIWSSSINGGAYSALMTLTSDGSVGINTTSPGSALDVKGTLRLSGATSGYVGLAPAAAAGSTTYTLPSADGSNGQQLTTNGSGTLSWAAAGGGSNAPDAFSFTDQTNVTPSTTITSNAVTLSGFTGALAAACTGCTGILRNGVSLNSTVGSFLPGDTATLQLTSASAGNTATATLTVGTTTSSVWSVTSSSGGCSGASVGSYCWYYASSQGQSCDTVCTSHGGCNLTGTQNYAGSSGTNTQCQNVLTALGVSGTVFSTSDQNGSGCARFTDDGTYNGRDSDTTTCSSTYAWAQRACACNN